MRPKFIMRGVSNNALLNRMSPLTIKLDPLILSDEQFYQLCQNNRDLRFERTCRGDLLIGIEIINASAFLRDSILESVQGKLLNLPRA